jgi:hypothetical protein
MTRRLDWLRLAVPCSAILLCACEVASEEPIDAPPAEGAGASSAAERMGEIQRSFGPHLPRLFSPDTESAAEQTVAVELPAQARGSFRVADGRSAVAVDVTLEGAGDAPITQSSGLAGFVGGGPDGSDVLFRVSSSGVEDFVLFRRAPESPVLRYDVNVTSVAGVRLVGNVFEMLDSGGIPRLRVAPPYVVDRAGRRRDAKLGVTGCAHDIDPRPPFRRGVVPPASPSCELSVSWVASPTDYPLVVDPQWNATGDMVSPRSGHTMTVLAGDIVLAAGGTLDGNVMLSSAEVFDPMSSTWASTSDMSVARGSAAAVVYNGDALVVGGCSGNQCTNFQSSAERWNPVTGLWTPAGNMATARRYHTATALNDGTVLVAGGGDCTIGQYKSAELYVGGATWVPTGNMAVGRHVHSATLLLDGRVLVAGGNVAPCATTGSAELYDPVAHTWSPTENNMTGPRHDAAVVRLSNGCVLAAGGSNGSPLASAEVYCPGVGWAVAPIMGTPRSNALAVPLVDGTALVVGGCVSGCGGVPVGTQSTTIFDAMGQWANGPLTLSPRGNTTGGVLSTGQVLVAGGNSTGGMIIAQSELLGSANPGIPCADGTICLSGFCVDGVCCDSSCGGDTPGDCLGCSIAVGAALDGACSTLSGTGCDDGDACTTVDTCQAGACQGASPVVCSASDPCHDAGACDPASGACSDPPKPDDSVCDDGDACTLVDSCQGGTCLGDSPMGCVALDECHDVGTCSSVTGVCDDPTKENGSPCAGGTCQSGDCVPPAGTGGGGGSSSASGGAGGTGGGAGGASAAASSGTGAASDSTTFYACSAGGSAGGAGGLATLAVLSALVITRRNRRIGSRRPGRVAT